MKPQRLCKKCQRPLSYYNLSEYCFRHTPEGEEWKIREMHEARMDIPWPGEIDDIQYPWEAIYSKQRYLQG